MTRVPTLACLLVLHAGLASAQAIEPIEVSEDAHRTARAADAAPTLAFRGADAPFPDQPDWTNTARRQIGALEIADMNGDGINDLVVGCFNTNSFPPYDDWRNFIHYGTGSGLEDQPSWVASDQRTTTDLKVGDLNGDGRPDIFNANGAGQANTIYYNTPSGLPDTSPGWTSSEPLPSFTTSVVLFDIDNDGDLDALTTNQGLGQNDAFRPMYLFRNLPLPQGGNALANAPVWQSAESSIQGGASVGDYDNDGDPDIFVSKWVNFRSGVYRNDNGTPIANPVFETTLTGADRGTATGDLNADGNLDFILGADDNTTSYLGNGEGAFSQDWVAMPPFNGPQDIRLADVDNDGDLDAGEVHFSDGRAHVYLNDNGTLSTTPSWAFDAPSVGNAIVFGDLNSDGVTDVAIGYSGEPSIRVFYGIAPDCPPDLNNDGNLTGADFNAFIAAFVDGDPAADLNADGQLTGADFNAFIAGFVDGCP